MAERPDHELQVLEVDQTVPPRPEEEVADVGREPDEQDAPGADHGAP